MTDPTRKNIVIRGARMHNLKNVTVEIPRNKLTVITGVSGSGKSSLAFDTLYAEGQRRYVESLSSYARQFLGRHDKPDVDDIDNISPAVAIEQRVTSRSSRSTVGSSTEVYDYLKLLFARIGKTYSPISGDEVKRHVVTDVVKYITKLPLATKVLILVKVEEIEAIDIGKKLQLFQQQGFSRIKFKGAFLHIEEALERTEELSEEAVYLVIDRLAVSEDINDDTARIADSINSAFYEGDGICHIEVLGEENNIKTFSNRFEADGMQFEEPNVHFFSFNNPVGACKTCEGYGSIIGVDPDLVIPDKKNSVFQDAVVCWKGEKMVEWKEELIRIADSIDFPIHRSIEELTPEQYNILWDGKGSFEGLHSFFKMLESNSYKIQYRVMLSRYRGKTPCHDCKGSRLRKDAAYVKINTYSILDLVTLPIKKLIPVLNNWTFDKYEQQVGERLMTEITSRLQFLFDVGLGYLMLNRLSNTLSGGESQRINLATSLGSSLVGSMYILDEPSIGLHPKDTTRLVKVLRQLQELGNSVIVVEHEEDVMEAADHIIDIGPYAGTNGGNIIATGTFEEIKQNTNSLTGQYLTGTKSILLPENKRKPVHFIRVEGAAENNLKNINVDVPLNSLCCITGVSGSGKSTFVRSILYPALSLHLEKPGNKPGKYSRLLGDYNLLKEVEFIDQNPIGKSSRSNPVTYVKAYDEIRALFAQSAASKAQGLKPSHFSFNVAGGRCDECDGEGSITVEMQFMADVHLQCEVCSGKRFKEDVLMVKYNGKSIHDVLEMTIDDALVFFIAQEQTTVTQKLIQKLTPLQKVGLGYVRLGQSSNTLSGGEAQRIKLASYLVKGNRAAPTLFIFDEPTTGLHFDDINKLLTAFNELIENGHSIIVIEHNLDVVKTADWVIDLGPEGGDEGGNLVFAGTPEDLQHCEASYTGQFLKAKDFFATQSN